MILIQLIIMLITIILKVITIIITVFLVLKIKLIRQGLPNSVFFINKNKLNPVTKTKKLVKIYNLLQNIIIFSYTSLYKEILKIYRKFYLDLNKNNKSVYIYCFFFSFFKFRLRILYYF